LVRPRISKPLSLPIFGGKVGNLEPRIMSYARQKIENNKVEFKDKVFKEKKKTLFEAYKQVDKIFGKPLSAFDVVTVISVYEYRNYKEIVFAIDNFTFRAKIDYDFINKSSLAVKSKVWYRRWYNTFYSAEVFKELVDKGKI
jgi:hypothetical protein